jgi:hypothetical protein
MYKTPCKGDGCFSALVQSNQPDVIISPLIVFDICAQYSTFIQLSGSAETNDPDYGCDGFRRTTSGTGVDERKSAYALPDDKPASSPSAMG